MKKIHLKFLEDLDDPSVIGIDDIILILQFIEKYGDFQNIKKSNEENK